MKTMVKMKGVYSSCVVAAVLVVCVALGSEAAEGDEWAAIAYAFDTGADGYSYGYGSADAAKQRALDECLLRGSDCFVAVWVSNACAALAVGFHGAEAPAGKLPDGQGVGTGESLDAAESKALNVCRRTATNCTVARSVCATPAAAAGCMQFDADEEIAEGRLDIERFQDAAGRPESSYILTVPVPTCLDAQDAEYRVGPTSTIHIYSSDETVHAQIHQFVGKTVLVRGRPFGAHTSHHHAPIVMDITEIDEQ